MAPGNRVCPAQAAINCRSCSSVSADGDNNTARACARFEGRTFVTLFRPRSFSEASLKGKDGRRSDREGTTNRCAACSDVADMTVVSYVRSISMASSDGAIYLDWISPRRPPDTETHA